MQTTKKTTLLQHALRVKAGIGIEPKPVTQAEPNTLTEGRRALQARRKDQPAIQARILELYGIPSAGLPALVAIDSRFRFSALDMDEDLQPLHVESHLESASALLNRCESEKTRHDELQIEKWHLQRDFDQFLRLSRIHDRERQAGIETAAYERAILEANAESSFAGLQRESESQLKGLQEELLTSGFNKRMAAKEVTAWLSSYPLKDHDLTGDEAHYAFDGVRRSKPDHLFEAARLEADEAAWEKVFTLMSQRYAVIAEAEAARLRRQSLEVEANWRKAAIALRGEREQAARDAVHEKMFQAQSPNCLLNCNERLSDSEQLFYSTLRDAMAHVTAARRGLSDLFDYTRPLPEEGKPGYLLRMRDWVRAASSSVERQCQQDQTYVLALSVKDLAKSQWEAGLAASDWSFDVGEEVFKGQARVRLRGVSLAVVGQKPEEPSAGQKKLPAKRPDLASSDQVRPEGYWSAQVWLPPTAALRHLSGTAIVLDQKTLPPCFLGRVADRDALRDPDVAGQRALYNASPIGKAWRISLSPKSTDGTPTAKLQDVQLYLHVAVRGLRA